MVHVKEGEFILRLRRKHFCIVDGYKIAGQSHLATFFSRRLFFFNNLQGKKKYLETLSRLNLHWHSNWLLRHKPRLGKAVITNAELLAAWVSACNIYHSSKVYIRKDLSITTFILSNSSLFCSLLNFPRR